MQREIQYISSLWKLFHSQKSCLVAPNHPVLQPASKPEALPPDVATVQQALFANRLYIPTCRACAQGWGIFYIRWHPRWENQNTQVPLIGWAQESKLPMPFFLGICWKSSLPATLTLTLQLIKSLLIKCNAGPEKIMQFSFCSKWKQLSCLFIPFSLRSFVAWQNSIKGWLSTPNPP